MLLQNEAIDVGQRFVGCFNKKRGLCTSTQCVYLFISRCDSNIHHQQCGMCVCECVRNCVYMCVYIHIRCELDEKVSFL